MNPPLAEVVAEVELAVLPLEAFVEALVFAALLVVVPPSGLLVFVVEFADVVVVRVPALEPLTALDVMPPETVPEPVSDPEFVPPAPLTGPT